MKKVFGFLAVAIFFLALPLLAKAADPASTCGTKESNTLGWQCLNTKTDVDKFVSQTCLPTLCMGQGADVMCCKPVGLVEGVATPQTQTQAFDKTMCQVPGTSFGFPCPLGGGADKLPQIFGRVIRWVLGLVGALFFAMFIYGGFMYIIAGENAKNAETGQKTLVNAVIGLAIVIGSYMIVSWIIGIFNAGLGINPPNEPAAAAGQTSQTTCIGQCLPSCSKVKLSKLSGTCSSGQECCSDNPY